MKWKCSICGAVFDELPQSVCPICGAPSELITETLDEDPVKEEFLNAVKLEEENPAVIRIKEKCIDCGQCKRVCEKLVGITYDDKKAKEAVCIHCGQCILRCPVGALAPRYHYKKVLDYLHDTSKIVTISIAPAVRVSLGEAFGFKAGRFVEEQLVAALKEVGFAYVFDLTYGADMTIMEEANELWRRLSKQEALPMFTSCCPAWVKYLEIYHPKLIRHLSTTKSPIGIQAALLNSYFLEAKNIKKRDIINVVVVPCTAKKFEIKREEFGNTSMDFALTTSEVALLLKESGVSLDEKKKKNFDAFFEKGSGAGVIFGSSGGVMEASLRTAQFFATGEESCNDFEVLRGNHSFKEAEVSIGNKDIKVLVVHGMKEVEPLLQELEQGHRLPYHFIEVMNCPGGCVGGGGQVLGSIKDMTEKIDKRSAGLYENDQQLKVRCSYQNKDVKRTYQDYLTSVGSNMAQELLHTSYRDRKAILGEQSH